MTLALTPDMLAGAYDYLRTTPPFRRWKLPAADDIEFRVVTNRDLFGYYERPKRDQHRIALSTRSLGYSANLLHTMAHEMVHMRLAIIRKQDRDHHGPNFQRLAKRVCKYHGFDPKVFC